MDFKFEICHFFRTATRPPCLRFNHTNAPTPFKLFDEDLHPYREQDFLTDMIIDS